LAPVATKGALQGFSPEFISFFRLAVAAMFFHALAGQGAKWLVADAWIWLAGVALGADFVLYNYGLQRTLANVAGLVINVGFAVWLLGERLTMQRLLGSAVTLGGVLHVTANGLRASDLTAAGPAFGNILVMAAGVSWSLFAVAQRRAHQGQELFHRLTPIFSVAALTTAPALLRPHAWVMSGGVTSTLMLGILTTLCTGLVYLTYARAQDLIDVSVLAILLCTIPVFAILFAAVLLDEPLSSRLLTGAVLVVSGIGIIAAEKGMVPEAPALLNDQSPSVATANGHRPRTANSQLDS
jgi:drug/metabolite transporter (DMT)-like permease